LAALAGIRNGNYMAGADLSPVLKNPAAAEVRDHILYHVDWEAVFTVNKSANENAIYLNSSHIRAIRDKGWKYALYFSPKSQSEEQELYNLKDDPLEMTNLAGDPGYSKKLKEMRDRMTEREDQLVKEYKS
jgi:arylsulfatase A-like enzyme